MNRSMLFEKIIVLWIVLIVLGCALMIFKHR
jgi:hypothetical protein